MYLFRIYEYTGLLCPISLAVCWVSDTLLKHTQDFQVLRWDRALKEAPTTWWKVPESRENILLGPQKTKEYYTLHETSQVIIRLRTSNDLIWSFTQPLKVPISSTVACCVRFNAPLLAVPSVLSVHLDYSAVTPVVDVASKTQETLPDWGLVWRESKAWLGPQE